MTSPIEVSADPTINRPRKSQSLSFKTPPSANQPTLVNELAESKNLAGNPSSPTARSDCSSKESTASGARLPNEQLKRTASENESAKTDSIKTPEANKSVKPLEDSKTSKNASVQTSLAPEGLKRDSNDSTNPVASVSKTSVKTTLNEATNASNSHTKTAAATNARAKPQSTQKSIKSSANPAVILPTTPIADDDVVFVDGQAFNGRGYPVCGVANQRGKRCGRIGTCPFHSGARAKPRGSNPSQSPTTPSKPPAKRPRSTLTSTSDSILPAPAASPPSAGQLLTNSVETENGGNPVSLNFNGKRSRAAQVAKREVAIPPRKARFKRSWTPDEHRLFLTAMRRHGRGKWKEIAADVKTRTANQCQSHAQKYFLRQAKSDSERKKKSIHDVTDVVATTDDAISPSAVVIQQPPSAALVPSTGSKPVVILPRTSQAVPLAPGPAPLSNSAAIGGDSTTLVHRVSQASVSPSAFLTCTGRGTTVPTISSQTVSTVPVVFPVSNYGNVQYAPLMQPILSTGNAASAAVVPPPPMAKLRVTVHVNGKLKGGMALVLPDTLDEFFEQAKSKLNFGDSFSRVFTRSGGEITCIDEMCPDDMLWLSAGEDFTTPR